MAEYKHEYRMSMAGACSRTLSATRLSINTEQAPDWLEEVAKESTRHEQWVIDDLQEEGTTIATCTECPTCKAKGASRQGIHVEIEQPLYKLVGHLDGLIIEDTRMTPNFLPAIHILEVKGLSRFRYVAWLSKGWEGFPAFAAQMSCYMHATKIASPPLLLVAKNRDTGQKDELLVERPPMEIEEIFGKYSWIEANARAGIQVRCDVEADSPVAKYCRCLDCPHRKGG